MSIRAVEWALSIPVGNHFAKLVLIALANNADDEMFQCWPSVQYLAQRCELSESTVYRAVSFLRAHEFLTTEHRRWPGGVRRTPKYTLRVNVLSNRQCLLSNTTQGPVSVDSRRTVNEPSQRLGAQIFVECGTDAWRAWERHFQKNKINPLGRPPRELREGRWGWYFPTEFPQ